MLLDNIIYMGNCGADKERENEGHDVMVTGPEIDINCIQDGKKRKPPGDTVDDCLFSKREELIDNGTKEEDMNESPDEESPGGRSDVGFLRIEINGGGGGNGVYVGA